MSQILRKSGQHRTRLRIRDGPNLDTIATARETRRFHRPRIRLVPIRPAPAVGTVTIMANRKEVEPMPRLVSTTDRMLIRLLQQNGRLLARVEQLRRDQPV